MEMRSSRSMRRYVTALLALLAAGFILLVLFGAGVYLGSVSSQENNDNSRAVLAYLSTAARAYDESGSISVRQGPQSDCLVFSETADGYERRIYTYDGELLEEYVQSGSDYAPENAQVIGKTDSFDIETVKDGLVSVSTDCGSVLLHMRSEEAG